MKRYVVALLGICSLNAFSDPSEDTSRIFSAPWQGYIINKDIAVELEYNNEVELPVYSDSSGLSDPNTETVEAFCLLPSGSECGGAIFYLEKIDINNGESLFRIEDAENGAVRWLKLPGALANNLEAVNQGGYGIEFSNYDSIDFYKDPERKITTTFSTELHVAARYEIAKQLPMPIATLSFLPLTPTASLRIWPSSQTPENEFHITGAEIDQLFNTSIETGVASGEFDVLKEQNSAFLLHTGDSLSLQDHEDAYVSVDAESHFFWFRPDKNIYTLIKRYGSIIVEAEQDRDESRVNDKAQEGIYEQTIVAPDIDAGLPYGWVQGRYDINQTKIINGDAYAEIIYYNIFLNPFKRMPASTELQRLEFEVNRFWVRVRDGQGKLNFWFVGMPGC